MIERVRYPRICPVGDQALLVEFGASYSRRTSRQVLAFDNVMNRAPRGVCETAPTLKSVLIHFDPELIPARQVENWCRDQLAEIDWDTKTERLREGLRWKLPVVYGGEHGPDLTEIPGLSGQTERQFIDSHTSLDLDVVCLGFSPGLAYLAELPKIFDLPRRQSYGRPVPAGSILVANRQTVLPATPIPTGWRRIGMTPVPTFLPDRKIPFLLAPGDCVRFYPVSAKEAEKISPETFWDRLEHARSQD
ncbi:MAG: carboxyltransferase domain-containing protein [Rhodobacteraceae bacterium]|nr:carboxyltransferase domain-containing protein [Paracoccaceae bacterium]